MMDELNFLQSDHPEAEMTPELMMQFALGQPPSFNDLLKDRNPLLSFLIGEPHQQMQPGMQMMPPMMGQMQQPQGPMGY